MKMPLAPAITMQEKAPGCENDYMKKGEARFLPEIQAK
jgi:hypothetical protein